MSITAKELARQLNLSEAAISMALHNKPGVSTATRKRIIAAAQEQGYDFSRITPSEETVSQNGTIHFVIYRKNGAVVPNSPTRRNNAPYVGSIRDVPFFSQLSEGIDSGCKLCGYRLNISYLYEGDDISGQLSEWKRNAIKGILLLGTEMERADLAPFLSCGLPFVLVDNYFEELALNCVMINNIQGAFLATEYLIRHRHSQPGYLHSSYSITGFEERSDGFFKAIRKNGLSTSHSVIHSLTPSAEGAYADMKELLASGETISDCYFADNDQIAAGAMRAFQENGYRIPQDISIVGFDDMPLCTYVNPPLTTIHVPKQYMGEMAVKRLAEIIANPSASPVKIEIATSLLKRKSS
jgi:LacI family transcriptional regulator